MASKKFDGVIEAVHFNDGQIAYVRAFERRGFAFTDRIILNRSQLLERLKSGRKFVTGHRRELFGGSFDTGSQVQAVPYDGHDLIATRTGATRDELEGVPFI